MAWSVEGLTGDASDPDLEAAVIRRIHVAVVEVNADPAATIHTEFYGPVNLHHLPASLA